LTTATNNETGKAKLKKAISLDSRRIHELMCIAAVIIFPVFAIFDQYTIPSEIYWPLTFVRFAITIIIGLWLFVQKKYSTNEKYLTYFAFTSISWFCCYACVAGGAQYLYQHNIAYCTVFLGASMFALWHWKHSVIVVISSILVYLFFIYYLNTVTLSETLLNGGAVLVTVMILHPIIILYRFNAYRREFLLKLALEQSNELLQLRNEVVEERNAELLIAREKLNEANKELKSINQNLKNLVDSRTNSLEETHTDLKEAVGELDLFLYSSYHDLKGPIARLKGLAQLSLRDVEDAKAKQYNLMFLDTINDMEFLMEKLNNVNTIYHHKVQKEYISVKACLNGALNQFAGVIEESEVEIKTNNIESIGTDKNLLLPVLYNLIENSLRFKKENEKHKLIISCKRENGEIIFSVWDNGCGIPGNVIPNIFNMFYRGNINSKGHGLGLYLAKKAIEKLNGTISVESREGVFTEVIFRLDAV
jgi:signal transduction histidine kinase